jgi:ribosome-binding factor A
MSRRTERVNQLLREEISELLRQAKDPRLDSFVTVTEVVISPDLRHAKVFVSILGDEKEQERVLAGLEAASGFLRRQLAPRLTMRFIPELAFVRDDSIERGSHLLQLIDRIESQANQGDSTVDH